MLTIITNYIINDIKKKPGSFKIGFFTVFLVVAFLTLLISVVDLTPVIFIRISENELGDADIIITPVAAVNDTRLADANFTSNPLSAIRLIDINAIDDKIVHHKDIVGISPRWFLFGTCSKPEVENNDLTVYLLLIDPERERQIGLGRNFDHPPLNHNEIYISESALRTLHMYNNDDPSMN